MTTELQNKVWSILPKEFKEEVKRLWQSADKEQQLPHDAFLRGEYSMLVSLFGHHNLTSDAEEEEMLMCEKSKIQKVYNTSREIVKAENPDSLMYSMHTQIMCILENIFGSKCLPDKEPKPAEPKNEGTRQKQYVPKNAESGTHLDSILKDGFRNERRLNIAAQILGSIVASGKPCRQPVKRALELTDALVAECKKGGDNA